MATGTAQADGVCVKLQGGVRHVDVRAKTALKSGSVKTY